MRGRTLVSKRLGAVGFVLNVAPYATSVVDGSGTTTLKLD
jgi:hypothetical protein